MSRMNDNYSSSIIEELNDKNSKLLQNIELTKQLSLRNEELKQILHEV